MYVCARMIVPWLSQEAVWLHNLCNSRHEPPIHTEGSKVSFWPMFYEILHDAVLRGKSAGVCVCACVRVLGVRARVRAVRCFVL